MQFQIYDKTNTAKIHTVELDIPTTGGMKEFGMITQVLLNIGLEYGINAANFGYRTA